MISFTLPTYNQIFGLKKEKRMHQRPHPIRQYLFPKQNYPYYCQKPRKATAFLRFVSSTQEILMFYETAKHLKKKNFSSRKGKVTR